MSGGVYAASEKPCLPRLSLHETTTARYEQLFHGNSKKWHSHFLTGWSRSNSCAPLLCTIASAIPAGKYIGIGKGRSSARSPVGNLGDEKYVSVANVKNRQADRRPSGGENACFFVQTCGQKSEEFPQKQQRRDEKMR
ncbi:MAG: hypothetical protein VB051_02850 [Candidatus Pelethousia sp.]|nr:hypothetical protein [Candidatus Pelethousia sp.]